MATRSAKVRTSERLRVIASLQQRAQALEREVAARRVAEEALKRREAELADLLDNALEGAQRTGPDQTILWANRAVLDLLGYTAEEYVGRPLADFFVHRYAFDEFWAKLMRREEVHDFPAALRCKSGRVVAVTFQSNGLWENGKFVHTRTFIHDVTARREMEAALRRARYDLEQRVRERTAELHAKNEHIVKQAETLDLTARGLRALSTKLLRVQDEERRRIARDLHDSTGQALALLSMNLSALEAEAAKSSPELAKGLGENATLVRQISAELRTLSYLLHPPLLEEMGLESALRWYIDGFGQRSNITVTLDLPADFQRLPRDVEITIFRIVQECLTNIHRHSGSPTAVIYLTQGPAELTMEVKDEGHGIPPETLARLAGAGEAGVGLRGMRERVKDFGGDLNIESSASGTVVRVTVPVTARVEEPAPPGEGNR
jgi:PAS domain S-box-containing protein